MRSDRIKKKMLFLLSSKLHSIGLLHSVIQLSIGSNQLFKYFVLLRYSFVSLILFVVEIEVVRHEETLTSSRYVFFKHTVMPDGVESPVSAEAGHLDMSRVQWNVCLRWRQLLSVTFINIYSVSMAQFARYLGIVQTCVSFAVAE